MTIAAVIGMGTMGAGIAAVMARAGFRVRAFDIDAAALARSRAALPAIAAVLDQLAPMPGGAQETGHAPASARSEAGDIAFCDSMAAAVAGAGLVLENVPEDLALKRQVLAGIAAAVGPECVLASDTSGLPITALQDGLPAPERVVGMHWSNPPHIVPMIEVVAGRHTGPATVAWTMETVRRLGHIPVRVPRTILGYLSNLYLLQVPSSRSSHSRISQDDPGIPQQPLASYFKCGVVLVHRPQQPLAT